MCVFFIFSKLKEITLARMFECRPLKSVFSFFSTSSSLFERQEEFLCLYDIVSQDAIWIAFGEALNTTGFVIKKQFKAIEKINYLYFFAVFFVIPHPTLHLYNMNFVV